MYIAQRYFIAAASLAAVALLPLSAHAAGPSVLLEKGSTAVVLSDELLGAATSLGVAVDEVGAASLNGATAVFPITGGVVDTVSAAGEIVHEGGLSLAAGNTRVTLTDFDIETTGAPQLTGLVTVNGHFAGRLPLFDLQLPALTLPLAPEANGKVKISKVGVTLTADAAAALNAAFHVTAFAAGLPIGVAKVKIAGFAAL